MKERHRPIEALIFGATLLFIIMFTGCRTHKQTTIQQPPVVLENIIEVHDTIKESHTEIEKEKTNAKEQTRESTTEKVTIVVNTKGDTIRTDREKTTIIDHWLMMENLRLQAKIDSLRFNQALKEKIEIPVYTEVPVEVEREFTAWEKFRLKAFWWLFGGLVLSAGWNFRKPIKKIINNLL